ncbi:hypothetical protein SRHO_G00039530 [Serrasalmus rhombeus]
MSEDRWFILSLLRKKRRWFTEFLEPFERVIQPEELWLYKNPLVESDRIPKRVMFAISFLTPLAVIIVVKIIQRTDKTEIKEACLGEYMATKNPH